MRHRIVVVTVVVALLLSAAAAAFAQGSVWVNPYVKKDGTYVEGHYRSAPDGNPYNNWSTQGNVNPYTGQYGTRDPNPQPSYSSPYSSPYGGGLSQPKRCPAYQLYC